MTYKPGGNNKKSVEKKRLDTAIEILEHAYISGNNVSISDKYSGETIIISPEAIPIFRELLIEKEFKK